MKTKQTLEVDNIVEVKLSSLIGQIEEILKPYRSDFRVETVKSNQVVQSIQITAKVYLR